MIKKIAKLSLLSSVFSLLPAAAFAAEISGESAGEFVSSFYTFALAIAGALAFGAIVYGGIKYTFAAGNPSGQSEGKDWVKSALLGLLLLAAAGLILRTINPKILNLTVGGLPPLPPGSGGGPPGGGGPNPTSTTPSACDNQQQLAQQNNEPYPAKRSAELQTFLNCIASRTGQSLPAEGGSNSFYGSLYTYDHSYPLCNYTRGQRTCSSCSHAVRSCHYGGASGSDGALAADFGNQANVDSFRSAAIACGTTASHILNEGNHIHISVSSCSGN